ncbi:MAG: hypothetical protein ACP5MV_01160 [Candidatus Parvarchaeum sp.]
MASFIQGVIPNLSFSSKGRELIYMFFSSSEIFLVNDSKVDNILSESPIGMWPASGAVIDASTPSASLSNFKEKMDKNYQKNIDYDYLNRLSFYVIKYSDIEKFKLFSDNLNIIKIEIETSKDNLDFITDYIDLALLEEYKRMLSTLLGNKFYSD